MTEQQQHLANLLEQRDKLNEELGKLQNAATGRRELFLKVQGAIEYLTQTGVELPEPEPEEESAELAETEVVEEELPTSKKKA
jgi:hypothetical protein|tara:strand:- start:43 stop:291 length:249 start_codon:yes stop_codon:yes gene_type:complete